MMKIHESPKSLASHLCTPDDLLLQSFSASGSAEDQAGPLGASVP
jgi:hypothetical protein